MKFQVIICFLFLTFGLAEQSYSSSAKPKENITLFPNPVNDGQLNIKSENKIVKIEILSIVGHIVYSKKLEPSKSVRLNFELESGVYLLKVAYNNNTSDTKRIWVN